MIPNVNRQLTQVGVTLVVVAGVIPALTLPLPAWATVVRDDSTAADACHGYFMGTSDGSPTITTDSGPNGSTITPGQRVVVTFSWGSSDIGRSEPAKISNCVEVGGTVSSSLSQQVRSGISGTSQQFSYEVPAQEGAELCDRGAVEGDGASTGKSEVLCYTIGPRPALPEVSLPIALPSVGIFTIGLAAVVLARRRSLRRS